MANRQTRHNINPQNRRHFTSHRLEHKVESILRLSNALQRDVDRISGQRSQQNTTQPMDINSKLDFISQNLVEIRDKLEAHHRQTPNAHNIQMPQPIGQPIAQPMPLSYPFIQRYYY